MIPVVWCCGLAAIRAQQAETAGGGRLRQLGADQIKWRLPRRRGIGLFMRQIARRRGRRTERELADISR